MNRFLKTTLPGLLAVFLIIKPVGAAIDLGSAVKLNSSGSSVGGTYPTLGSLISTILPNILIISGIIFLFLAVFGGLTVVTSAGNPEATQKGQQTLMGAIIGFVIVFASYWIVQIIEVLTGINIFNSTILQ